MDLIADRTHNASVATNPYDLEATRAMAQARANAAPRGATRIYQHVGGTHPKHGYIHATNQIYVARRRRRRRDGVCTAQVRVGGRRDRAPRERRMTTSQRASWAIVAFVMMSAVLLPEGPWLAVVALAWVSLLGLGAADAWQAVRQKPTS